MHNCAERCTCPHMLHHVMHFVKAITMIVGASMIAVWHEYQRKRKLEQRKRGNKSHRFLYLWRVKVDRFRGFRFDRKKLYRKMHFFLWSERKAEKNYLFCGLTFPVISHWTIYITPNGHSRIRKSTMMCSLLDAETWFNVRKYRN